MCHDRSTKLDLSGSIRTVSNTDGEHCIDQFLCKSHGMCTFFHLSNTRISIGLISSFDGVLLSSIAAPLHRLISKLKCALRDTQIQPSYSIRSKLKWTRPLPVICTTGKQGAVEHAHRSNLYRRNENQFIHYSPSAPQLLQTQ